MAIILLSLYLSWVITDAAQEFMSPKNSIFINSKGELSMKIMGSLISILSLVIGFTFSNLTVANDDEGQLPGGTVTAIAVCYAEEDNNKTLVHEVDIWQSQICDENSGRISSGDMGCGGGSPCVRCLSNLKDAGLQITQQSGSPFQSTYSADFHSTWYTLEGNHCIDEEFIDEKDEI